MATEHVLEDKELGRLLVRVNVRARRLTFRTREDAIHVTVPPGTTIGEVKNAVEQLRPRLRAARQQQSRPLIDLDYRIDTEFFKLSLVGGERDRFLSRSELGEMQIICPPDADFSNKELQAWLRKVIEEALRRNAVFLVVFCAGDFFSFSENLHNFVLLVIIIIPEEIRNCHKQITNNIKYNWYYNYFDS